MYLVGKNNDQNYTPSPHLQGKCKSFWVERGKIKKVETLKIYLFGNKSTSKSCTPPLFTKEMYNLLNWERGSTWATCGLVEKHVWEHVRTEVELVIFLVFTMFSFHFVSLCFMGHMWDRKACVGTCENGCGSHHFPFVITIATRNTILDVMSW